MIIVVQNMVETVIEQKNDTRNCTRYTVYVEHYGIVIENMGDKA